MLIISFGVLAVAVALELWSSRRCKAREQAFNKRLRDIAEEARYYLDDIRASFVQVTAAIEQLDPHNVKASSEHEVQPLPSGWSKPLIPHPSIVVRIPVQLRENSTPVYLPPRFEREPGYVPELLPLILRDLERRGVVSAPNERIVRNGSIIKISVGRYDRVPTLFLVASNETFQVVNRGNTEAEHLLTLSGRLPVTLDFDDIISSVLRITVKRRNRKKEVFLPNDLLCGERSQLEFVDGFSYAMLPIYLGPQEQLGVTIERQTTGPWELGYHRDEFLAGYQFEDGCRYVIRCDPWSDVLIHPTPFSPDFECHYTKPRKVGKPSELRAAFKETLKTNEGISLRADFCNRE